MNTIGRIFRLTTFGESHGACIGGVLDGCPAGLHIDQHHIRECLQQRRGYRHATSTKRQESDQVRFVSGIHGGITTGTPIAYEIDNAHKASKDYSDLQDVYRPGHADYTYSRRYGVRDADGGGRASARETAARVVAGAIAQQILAMHGIEVLSYTTQVGQVAMHPTYFDDVSRESIVESSAGCPISELDELMSDALIAAYGKGDTLGGVVATVVRGVPAGWGSPLYDKLSARLSYALMSINACKGVEIGDGFGLASMYGSEANDGYYAMDGYIRTRTNHAGGIVAGISNGEPLHLRAAFKPISSHHLPQQTVDTQLMPREITIGGRHDTSVFPRVLPIVDAMVAMVLVDELLHTPSYRLPL